MADYRLRYRGITFAEYAIGHVIRLLGDKLVVDVDDATVLQYQSDRLKESAAPKSINEEVRFLLTLLGDSGELIRARLRKKKKLKLPTRRKIGKAYEPEETHRMRDQSRDSHSPHMRLALPLAINAGMRDAEIKALKWSQIHLDKQYLQVGASKTPAGEGRTIPINSALHEAIVEHRAWYLKKFKEIRPEWYVFPFGKPRPQDPPGCDHPEDCLEDCAKEGECYRKVARPPSHTHHPACRKRGRRRDDPPDRRTCLEGSAQRLPSRSDEGQEGCTRVNRDLSGSIGQSGRTATRKYSNLIENSVPLTLPNIRGAASFQGCVTRNRRFQCNPCSRKKKYRNSSRSPLPA